MLNCNLKGFDERPQQSPDTFSTGQQLNETHHSEQPEKTDAHERATFLHSQTITNINISLMQN